jgi:hypothetical protein
MQVAPALGFFLLVAAVHAQDLPAKPGARSTESVQASDAAVLQEQAQFTSMAPKSEEMISDVSAQPLPDKPEPVAREGQWIRSGEDLPQFSDDLVMVSEKNDGRRMWHVRKVNSCDWCGAPMTWKQAMFDKKSSSMWAIRSALFVADIEIAHHLPCFQDGTCKEGNPLLGQTRLQGYSVAAGLTAISWIGEAYARKGDRNWRIGGYKDWWIVPTIGYVTSAIGIITSLASWHSR